MLLVPAIALLICGRAWFQVDCLHCITKMPDLALRSKDVASRHKLLIALPTRVRS